MRTELNYENERIRAYNWKDGIYSSFMIKFLKKLEPRFYRSGEIILKDMEEVEEIQFVIKGEFTVGYQVNNEEHLAMKMSDRNVIGDISIMFRRRSEFFYRAISDMDCQAIRRHDFYEIVEKNKVIGTKLKARAFERYREIIRKPVIEHKIRTYEKIYLVHPSERAKQSVIDLTEQDEKTIIEELENIKPENSS